MKYLKRLDSNDVIETLAFIFKCENARTVKLWVVFCIWHDEHELILHLRLDMLVNSIKIPAKHIGTPSSYLKGTLDYKLIYSKHESSDLCGYCDSEWGSDRDDRKSCTGYVFLWQRGAVSWLSKKQSIVTELTAEAEYVALSNTSKELVWLRQFTQEILGVWRTRIVRIRIACQAMTISIKSLFICIQ